MNKRSYLDTLNEGRQRRPHTTLEQLNRSLETLEQRLGRSREEIDPRYGAEPRYPAAQPYAPPLDDPRFATQPYDHPRAYQRQHNPAPVFDQAYQAIARDIDRVRGQEDGIATVSRIAGELRGLREELRHQMTAGLQREFDSLRTDLERALASGGPATDTAELGIEFERLSGAIQALAEKSDDKNVNLLRLDLEQVKTALDALAREESVQAVDRRWDDFDRRWSAFEDRVEAGSQKKAEIPELAALTERLEQINDAVNNLPESLSLRSLEEKVRTLAGAVDHFASQQSGGGSETFRLIDERLDEISRAIVASTVAAQANAFDPAPFERIEQRIASLASQIEEVAGDHPPAEVIDRLNTLSRRVDEVADRLDRQMPELDGAGIMEAIDARFTALATRLETRAPDPAGEAVMRGLEGRLQDISTRLDSSAAQVSNIDPALIRSLETQVAGLSAHLSKPGTPLPDFEDISPRLNQIEQSLAGTRDSILQAAREAAESAVGSLSGSGTDAAVAGLAQDLKALEALTRRSDERNSKTFEAIHDTLLKIVDRLGTLEDGEIGEQADEDAGRRAKKIAVQDAPSMDLDQPLPLADAADLDDLAAAMSGEPAARTPAEAAAAAAKAALSSEQATLEKNAEPEEKAGRRSSMFSGLARAFGGKKEAETPPLAGSAPVAEAPAVELDEPLDPKLANRPLEPGSGAPDLSAIMKRVRDERGQPAKGEADAAKSDFIAAARRAAQAAAAEAEVLKRQSTIKGPVRALRIGDLLKARRKPILMAAAAIMMALAGLQLGKAFLADPTQTAGDAAPGDAEQPAQAASVAASEPAAAAEETAAASDPVRVVGQSAAPQSEDDGAVAEPADISAPSDTMADAADVDPGTDPVEAASTAAEPPALQSASTADEPAASSPAEAASNAPPAAQPIVAAPVAPFGMTHAAPPADAAAVDIAKLDIPAEAGPAALREAAAGGDPKALFEIGSRYAEARGVKEDMAAAAKWYQKAADLGFAPAEYRIGNFYEKGIGVARDIKKSKTWYQLAAEQGNASAMHNLAVLFAMAADGVTDNESAVRWFDAAAELGVRDSQFNLGILAAKGVGMKQDLEESYKWFALVAKAGDKDAAEKRDEIAKSLSPEQLKRAKAAAELWKAKPLDPAANSVDIPESWQDGTPSTTAGIDMKKAVRNIQLILNKNGYEAGGADGIMGDKTRNAIMAFQSDNDMSATGKVDEQLVKALLAKK